MFKKIISKANYIRSKPELKYWLPNPRNSDIYLVSYPKSGNTWMRYLLAYAIWPDIGELNLVEMASYMPSFGIEHDAKMMLDPDSPCNKIKHRIIKEHFCYNEVAKKNVRLAIYIVRDGRDAMVSYWHFVNQQRGTSIPFSEFIEQSASHAWGPWSEHVKGWLNAPLERKLILRYEDMLADTEACLKKALEFTEISVDGAVVREAVKRASFESMRKLEETKGFNLDQLKNVQFVRNGKKGSWQENFGPDDLDCFNRFHGGPVPELNYVW